MAAHVFWKNEFTEDEKYHNHMSWLNYYILKWEIQRPKFEVSLCLFMSSNTGHAFKQNFGYFKNHKEHEERI